MAEWKEGKQGWLNEWHSDGSSMRNSTDEEKWMATRIVFPWRRFHDPLTGIDCPYHSHVSLRREEKSYGGTRTVMMTTSRELKPYLGTRSDFKSIFLIIQADKFVIINWCRSSTVLSFPRLPAALLAPQKTIY